MAVAPMSHTATAIKSQRPASAGGMVGIASSVTATHRGSAAISGRCSPVSARWQASPAHDANDCLRIAGYRPASGQRP